LTIERTPSALSALTDEESAWIPQAQRLDIFGCDAVFHIAPSFYIGPDNGMTSLEWATTNIQLPPLDLPRQAADEVETAELLEREDELVSHYRRLIAVAETYGKAASLQRPFPYFRTQPAIVGDERVTTFSWNDDVHETRAVLAALPNLVRVR
jgi:hypothetical protein